MTMHSCGALIAPSWRNIVLFIRFITLLLLLPIACFGQSTKVVRGPYIQAVTQNSVTILWFTAKPADSRVLIRPIEMPQDWQTDNSSGGHSRHQVTFKNLSPDSKYCYQVIDAGTNCIPFQTAPLLSSSRTVRIAALGDSGFGNTEQMAVATQIEKWKPEAILHLGDIVYPDGEFKNYDAAFFKPYANLISSVPFFTTIGNHDATELGTYLHFFAPPFEQSSSPSARFYSFNYGPILFFALDSNLSFSADSAQMIWLQSQLQKPATASAPWRIAFIHHTSYSADKRGGRKTLREQLVPLLEAHNFDLVLSGHDHAYQRLEPPPITKNTTRGPVYLVSGGGGAKLSPQFYQLEYLRHYAQEYHFLGIQASNTTLEVNVVNSSGKQIDGLQMSVRSN